MDHHPDRPRAAQTATFDDGAGAASAKRTRSESLPVQRKAVAGVVPAPGEPASAPALVGDDPFGFHLAGAGDRPALQLITRGSGPAADPGQMHEAAAQGIAGHGGPLPHLESVQRSFGHHDVTGVQAHVDAPATAASGQLDAAGYAMGNHVAFAATPDLHTVAHEAAHVVQQRGGVQLKGGVGEAGDAYEQHADAVAEQVVKGGSAEALLDAHAPANGGKARGAASGKDSKAAAAAGSAAAEDAEAAAPMPAEDAVQLITHTVNPNPGVAIDINTLDDVECSDHLKRIGRQAAAHPIGTDSEYAYDPGDKAAIQLRQKALVEGRRLALVAALGGQLAALGTAADHGVQPPWHGLAPAGVDGPEVPGAAVAAVEGTVVGAWTAFLGAGPYSHKHPRTGAVDNTRLVSADGQRSIRYGNHERNLSTAPNHHFHQETWVYDAVANQITVNNTLRRVPVK